MDGLKVLQGSYSIESPIDIDALLPYKEITGDLIIHAPGLLSLDGLQCLTRVGGDLEISDTALTNLTGLEGLEVVDGQVVIQMNAALADLKALGSLSSIGAMPKEFGYLKIKGNQSLLDLTGLAGLTKVGWSVEITGNGIKTLSGLGSALIGGELRFEYNADLVDVLDVAEFLPKSTVYFGHNHKLPCTNALEAEALMKTHGYQGSAFLYDNLNGCGT